MHAPFPAPALPVQPARLMLLAQRKPMLMMELAIANVSAMIILINIICFFHRFFFKVNKGAVQDKFSSETQGMIMILSEIRVINHSPQLISAIVQLQLDGSMIFLLNSFILST